MDATLAAFAMAMAARIRALQALVLGSEAGRIEAGRIAAEEEAASGQAPTRDPPPVEEQPSGSACKRARLAAKEERRRLKRLRRQAEREADQQQPQDQQQDQQQRHGDGPAAAGAAEAAAEAAAAAGEAEAGPAAPPELYRFWAPADVAELVLLVEDAAHRSRCLGSQALDWGAIAARFQRSIQAVRSKYRHEKVTGDSGAGDGGQRARQGGGGRRRQVSYSYMALFGMQSLPGQTGTGEEVCRAVEAHGPFAALLDRSTRADSAGVQRWQQRIREELSHRAYFKSTGQKRGGETVWVLDSSEFDAMPERQRGKLADLRLPGVPQLGRHGTRN